MRKNLLAMTSMLSLIVAAPALANDSMISQIGGSNMITVDQSGGNEGASTINQIGSSLTATVTQADDPNVGTPDFSVAANSSTIQQEGSDATANVNQTGDPGETPGNISEISQFSDGVNPTLADVSQNGANNFSSVEQGRDVEPEDRSGQTAMVTQDGVDHTSTVLQRGNLNDATVDQSGSGNTSDVTQSGLDNVANATQSGMGNLSTITQGANFGQASVNQSGDANTSDIIQDGRANSSIAATISQSGNNNLSNILQTSLVSGAGSADQFAEVTQATDNNESFITQDGGDPVVDASNPGNSATVSQTFTSGNYSNIAQSGAGNTANVMQ